MSVQQSIVNGFISRRGLITHSMLGSRNGSDGTGDCSGIMSQVLKEAGIPIQGLPSTCHARTTTRKQRILSYQS